MKECKASECSGEVKKALVFDTVQEKEHAQGVLNATNVNVEGRVEAEKMKGIHVNSAMHVDGA